MPKQSNKIGKKFGRLTVLRTVPKLWGGRRYTLYECLCDCGKEVTTALINAKSCGCFQKEDVAERSRKALGFAAKTAVLNYYKRNAKTRGYEWALSREQFEKLTSSNCHYCRVLPEDLFVTPEGSKFCRNGIDRLDNEKGYTEENSVACCKICNRAKGTLSYETFLTWISKVKHG